MGRFSVPNPFLSVRILTWLFPWSVSLFKNACHIFSCQGKDPEGSVSKGDHQRPSSGKLWSWQVEPLAIRRKLGDGTTPSSDVYFGDGSLLVVDVSELKEKAAITGASSEGGPSQTAVITSEFRLHIINAVKDDDLTVLASFSSITNGTTAGEIGWAGIDVNPDRMLITEVEVREDSASNYSVVAHSTVETASKVLPGLDEEFNPAMSHVWNNSLNDLNSPDMGIRFLSRAANSDYIPDAHRAAATIESATRIAFAGAVPQMTKMASDSATNSVVNRMSFANPEKEWRKGHESGRQACGRYGPRPGPLDCSPVVQPDRLRHGSRQP